MEKAIQPENYTLDTMLMPPQRIAYTKKNKDWYVQNELYLEALLLNNNLGNYTSVARILDNKNLFYYNIVNRNEVAQIVNPHGGKGIDIPEDFKHYPRGVPRVNTLVGEELKRRFEYSVYVTNRDAITAKEQSKLQVIEDFIVQQIQEAGGSKEDLDKAVEEFQSTLETWQDIREKGASELLKYLWTRLNLKQKFNDGFEEQIVTAKEIYKIDELNGKPIFEKCNSELVYFLKSPNSPYIDEADASVEIDYVPAALACDLYHEYLRPDDIDYIMKRYGGYPPTKFYGPEAMWSKGYDQATNAPIVMPLFTDEDVEYSNPNQPTLFKGFFDQRGNIRRVHVRWKGLRKVGKLTYFDEYGKTQTTIVSEEYKANVELGESIEWQWITEVYETTRLGEKIFLKMQPRVVQYRQLDNYSACNLGYAGIEMDRGLYDLIKRYELQADAVEYRINEAFAKYLGRLGTLDLANMPAGWNPQDIMFFAQKMGFRVIDSFKEGNKGAAMGKLAGNQSGQAGDMQVGDPEFLRVAREELNNIEIQLDSICGVNSQRRGEKSSGGLGTDQLQLQASSNITEKYFYMHEECKLRALRLLLETAKWCIKNDSEWVQYVTNDQYINSVKLDGDLINDADYNVQVGFSFNDQSMLNMLQQETAKAVQTGMVTISQAFDIASNDSVPAVRRKLERAEKQQQEQQQKTVQAEQQHQMALEQEKTAQIHAQLELKKYEIDTRYRQAIDVAEINALGFAQADTDIISGEADNAIKQQELAHKQFQVQLDHTLKLKAEDTKAQMKDKELSFKEKELATKERLEREKLKVERENMSNDIQIARLNKAGRNKS